MKIQTGYVTGALGRVIELHELYYGKNWNLGLNFSREVAVEFTDFLGRYEDSGNRLWLVLADSDDPCEQTIMGSLVIDGGPNDEGEEGAKLRFIDDEEKGARLRWVVLVSELHGQGLGRELLDRAMTYCIDVGFERVYLWTFEGLEAARHLYEEHGFTLIEEVTRQDWGPKLTYQKFENHL